MTGTILFVLVLNFGISWWNAYAVGKCWIESKALGGWLHLVTWSGAVMSALGFSSVYICILVFGLHGLGQIDDRLIEVAMSFWYLLVIIPILASGLIITLESWRQWYRDRSLLSLSVAGWNTYAQIHNAMEAIGSIGDAAGEVGKAFSEAMSGDDDAEGTVTKAGLVLVILVVAVALLAGTLHTVVLIKRYAASDPVPLRQPA